VQADDVAYKAGVRRAWALGDYHRFASDLMWSLGAELVSTCRIGPADRVLDVAAGSGNAALRAAEAGATVVASDLTPENMAAGRRAANELGCRSTGSRPMPKTCRSPTPSSTS
jgi:2-polyprenyl-3-methyl-5-hydroxy-6-metoxy-1,4-benzoquinol methylase